MKVLLFIFFFLVNRSLIFLYSCQLIPIKSYVTVKLFLELVRIFFMSALYKMYTMQESKS